MKVVLCYLVGITPVHIIVTRSFNLFRVLIWIGIYLLKYILFIPLQFKGYMVKPLAV